MFDAVSIYTALEPHAAMTPMAKAADARVARLVEALARAVEAASEDAARQPHGQLVAALRRTAPAAAAAWLGARPARRAV